MRKLFLFVYEKRWHNGHWNYINHVQVFERSRKITCLFFHTDFRRENWKKGGRRSLRIYHVKEEERKSGSVYFFFSEKYGSVPSFGRERGRALFKPSSLVLLSLKKGTYDKDSWNLLYFRFVSCIIIAFIRNLSLRFNRVDKTAIEQFSRPSFSISLLIFSEFFKLVAIWTNFKMIQYQRGSTRFSLS